MHDVPVNQVELELKVAISAYARGAAHGRVGLDEEDTADGPRADDQ